MTFPTMLVQAAFVADPFAVPVWTDITTRTRSVRINRGRRGERDTFQPGTAVLAVDNRDRALEPEYTASPYSPNVRPNRRVRVSADGTPIFDGFIDSIKPTYSIGPTNAGDALVEVSCTDLTKFLARASMEAPYSRAVRLDEPTHWWRFADPDNATVMRDSGSSPVDGSWTDRVELGSEPLALGSSSTTANILGTDTTPPPGTIPAHAMPSGDTWTWEALIQRPDDITDGFTLFSAIGPTGTSGVTATFNVNLTTSSILGETGVFLNPQYFSHAGTTWLNDQYTLEGRTNPIHIAFARSGTNLRLYLNGALVVTRAVGAGVGGWLNIRIGEAPAANFGYAVRAGEMAIYDGVALSAGQLLAHAEAAQRPWNDDSTGERISRLAEFASIPTALQSVDTGETAGLGYLVEPVDGQSVLTLARQVEATEQGALYVSKAGVLTFRHRHRNTNTSSVATFGDGAGELPYSDLVESYSEDTIVNRSVVARDGGTPQVAEDATSQAAYGVFAEDVSAMYATDAEAFDAATHNVARFGNPLLRFDAVTVHGSRSTDLMTQCRTREIGDRVTVNRRPPGGGAVQSKVVHIEGIQHEISAVSRSWVTQFALSPAETRTYWQLGRAGFSELGSTTRLTF